MANIFKRLFAVPQPPTVNPPPRKKSKAKKTDRVNQNWNATPERRLLKCILGRLVRTGLARSDLLVEFKRLVPDFQAFFDTPVSDSALYGRADTGRRTGRYAAENPDVHPLTKPYWEVAGEIVRDGVPLTADDVRRIVGSGPKPEPVEASPKPDDDGAAEIDKTAVSWEPDVPVITH